MDTKKLVRGLSSLSLIIGALLVLFARGGLLNNAAPDLPPMMGDMFGQLGVKPVGPGLGAAGPITGFVFLVLGAAGFIVASAMKPATGKPDGLA